MSEFIERLLDIHASGRCVGGSRDPVYGYHRSHSQECRDMVEADRQERLNEMAEAELARLTALILGRHA